MSKYNTQESERKRQDFRESEQVYAFDLHDITRPIYSIDTPPPTVSGKLHIGHIFSYTQAECIARYKRMTGHNVFYPMGYDNNGIPTEILVEKELGINIKDTARRDFIQKCLEVIDKYKDVYKSLRQSLGMSIDWNRSYATIDPKVQAIAQRTFIALLQKGIIYKKNFPALRCTKNQTTIAQAETEEQEFNEFFNDIKFTVEDGSECVIATTRPELLPACVAVFVHPQDDRYHHIIGKMATTPLGRQIPIIADDKVKMDKGTGAVMCCSYGDETDTYWIIKHKLPEHVIVDRYGKLFNTGLADLDGLKVADARNKIIEILEPMGVILKRTPIVMSRTISERGKVPVEIIPVPQRFVQILDQKDAIKKQNDQMRRFPDHMHKRSTDWIDKLQRDRNISRNRKFGIPIPIRYSQKTGEMIFPSVDQFPVDPVSDVPQVLPEGHTVDDILADDMVLDTRFTSGLTPEINQAFLREAGSLLDIQPFNLRPQAHDIIRTRLLYTTLHSYNLHQQIPFRDIMISGHVLAGKGEKISKSAGNAKFEPVSLLQTFGADATRYWSLSGQLGKDMVFEETELKNGQKLVTKLRNAANFVQMQLSDFDPRSVFDSQSLYPTDRRILTRLQETTATMRKNLENYEIGLAKIHFSDFFRTDFCDIYLEMVKTRVYQPDRFTDGQSKRLAGQWTLYHTLYAIIRLIAPYIPHVTEEIYQTYFKQFETYTSLHQTSYPIVDDFTVPAVDDFAPVLQVVADVRKYKTEKQLSLGAEIESVSIQAPAEHIDLIQSAEDDIIGVTKAKNISYKTGAFALSYK